MARSGTAEVPRGEARRAQAKAAEFFASAQADFNAARFNAAGLAAIHSGISACDAALIGQTGLRSISQNHAEVLDLLDEQVDAFSAAQRRQLTGLIKMKSVVAYEQRLLTEAEAVQLVDHARRLVRWSARLVAGMGST